MSIDRLTQVLPPPAAPLEAQGDWAKVEAELKTALPADYKEFIRRYGTGNVNEFIWVRNPFSANDNLNLIPAGEFDLEALRSTRDEFPEDFKFTIYPEPDGYLPWGVTANGDGLHWKTGAAPDQWTIAVTDSRAPLWEEFPETLTSFLARLLAREISCKVFPKFPRSEPVFKPEA
jgi:SMI1-KNR4 cell-wall